MKGKDVLKVLLNPAFAVGFLRFEKVFPIMSFVVAAALLILFHRTSRNSRGDELTLFVGFLGPLAAMGFLDVYPWQRHLYMIYPFFLLIYVWSLVRLTQYVAGPIVARLRFQRIGEFGTFAVAATLALALSNAHSFREAKSVSMRNYSAYPDHKSAALFVSERKRPGDIFIFMEPHTAIYVGEMDYFLRTHGFVVDYSARPERQVRVQWEREGLFNTPIIRNVKMLGEVVEPEPGKNIWLVTNRWAISDSQGQPGLREVIHFLDENKDKVVYTANDNITRVYLWTSQTH